MARNGYSGKNIFLKHTCRTYKKGERKSWGILHRVRDTPFSGCDENRLIPTRRYFSSYLSCTASGLTESFSTSLRHGTKLSLVSPLLGLKRPIEKGPGILFQTHSFARFVTHAITAMTIDITIFDATKREFNPPLIPGYCTLQVPGI